MIGDVTKNVGSLLCARREPLGCVDSASLGCLNNVLPAWICGVRARLCSPVQLRKSRAPSLTHVLMLTIPGLHPQSRRRHPHSLLTPSTGLAPSSELALPPCCTEKLVRTSLCRQEQLPAPPITLRGGR